MRNIALSDFDSFQLKNLKACDAFCQSVNLHEFYAYGKGKIIKITGHNIEVIYDIYNTKLPFFYEGDDYIPKAVDISCCYEEDLLHLILDSGDIISFEFRETVTESFEFKINDSGIKAAQWSPNKEVLVIVSGEDNVVVLTQKFQVVSTVYLHGSGFGEREFINVGWGNKETQFRGSEGKFIAKDEYKEKCSMKSKNSDTVKISWRGDAEYFAVSCINPDTSRTYLRIFSKNGILQYTSEDVPGLENSLCWSPSGSLIASTQVLPNKYVVCFFEKNGLKHGEFKLPLSSQEIKVDVVLWNNDSKILAVLITEILKDEFSDDEIFCYKSKFIYLYTVNNYHWYHKYTISFDLDVPLIIKWDELKQNTLNIIIKTEKNKIYFKKYSWLWTINKSKGSSLENESLVAVIDGSSLKVTSFSRGIIPPPLCTHTIQLSTPINSVSFAPNDLGVSSNDLFVQLSNKSLIIFKFNGSKGINFEFVGEIKNLCRTFEVCFNIQWVKKNVFMLCTVKCEEDEVKSYLALLKVENFESQNIAFEREDISLHSTIALLRASESVVLIYNNAGELYSFNKNDNSLMLKCLNKKTFLDLEVKDKQDGGFNFFALDSLNKFYINDRVALQNVLSFHLHENFIILTTMKNELLCFNAESELIDSDLSDVCTRKVERGSRIVTSVHKDSKVILQMPRGNLECVQPRALSLFVLGKYLDSSSYFSAFDLMRKQRINLNLLYDHNPVLFSENIDLFLEQIKDLQWINLFLSDLSDEDVTQTMYSFMYNKKKTKESNAFGDKIGKVCDLIEKTLTQKENSENYLCSLLMCYIKRGKTEYLEKALLKLKDLRDKEQNGKKSPVSFDEAFKYILYLIDVEELYKIALGMYDFDLVLVIASKSQKDPKEYLEFLNELNKLEPDYQKFRIDKYLKRYKKALCNLVKCDGDDVFSECINFIKTHKLYKHALKLVPKNTDRYKSICVCYGDELMKSDSFEEAGIMYSKVGNYKNAMHAYSKAGNWREVIICGLELKLDQNELNKLYLNLAMELSELKNFKDSAIIYLDYLKNVNECVKNLSKGKNFAEAYRVSHLYGRPDLIEQTIVPEIIEQGDLMLLHISNFKETFVSQKNRLEVVRKQKAKMSEEKYEFVDLYSETNSIITQTSATSRTTNRTYRSAKNRRKQERKLLSLKEGSPHEDLALITSLHNIATNCMALKSEVKELNRFLLKIGRCEIAEKIQNGLEELLKIIESSKSEIWTSDLLNSRNRHVFGAESTSNEISAMFMRSESVTPTLLNIKYSFPPETQNNVKWQLKVLNS